MKNTSTKSTRATMKFTKTNNPTVPGLSDNAFYLMALAGELKKLLGPASLSYFLDTGETVVFSRKAS